MLRKDEVCKVKRSVIDSPEARGYAHALVKRVNKRTVRIITIDDYMGLGGELTVQMSDLWRLKAKQRKQLQQKLAAQTVEDQPPSEEELDEALLLAPEHLDPPELDDAIDVPNHALFAKVVKKDVTLDGLKCVYVLKVRGSDTVFTMAADSVLSCNTGAIVNAANCEMLGGGGIDGAIGRAGGQALYNARKSVEADANGTRCETGDAKLTISGDLMCDYVIHAVGPDFYVFSKDEGMTLLANSYKNALLRAQEQELKTVAFCILSAGIFRAGVSLREIVEMGIQKIAENVYPGLQRVHLCFFAEAEVDLMHKYCEDLCPIAE